MNSHSDGEIWGLCCVENKIVTTGDDNKVMLWDSKTRKLVKSVKLNEKAGEIRKIAHGASTMSCHPPNQCARAVTYNTSKNMYTIAHNNGEISTWDTELSKTSTISNFDNWSECISYSPDGEKVVVGYHGKGKLELYKVQENGSLSLLGSIDTQAPTTHLDWLEDGS